MSISDDHDVGNGPRLLEKRPQLLLIHVLGHLGEEKDVHTLHNNDMGRGDFRFLFLHTRRELRRRKKKRHRPNAKEAPLIPRTVFQLQHTRRDRSNCRGDAVEECCRVRRRLPQSLLCKGVVWAVAPRLHPCWDFLAAEGRFSGCRRTPTWGTGGKIETASGSTRRRTCCKPPCNPCLCLCSSTKHLADARDGSICCGHR